MSSLLRRRLPCIRSCAVHRNLFYSSDGVVLLDRGEHIYCVTMPWLRSGCGVCIEDVAVLPHELLDPPQDTQRQYRRWVVESKTGFGLTIEIVFRSALIQKLLVRRGL